MLRNIFNPLFISNVHKCIHLFAWSFGRLVVWSLGRLFAWSLGGLFIYSFILDDSRIEQWNNLALGNHDRHENLKPDTIERDCKTRYFATSGEVSLNEIFPDLKIIETASRGFIKIDHLVIEEHDSIGDIPSYSFSKCENERTFVGKRLTVKQRYDPVSI